jgi:hypothetical protein
MLRNTFAIVRGVLERGSVFSVPSNSAPRLAAPEPCVALQERYPCSHGLGPHQTMNKRNRIAARLTRGSQPGRRREKGKRFSTDDQPKRSRGRPPGATNLMTRELKEAILGGCSDCGADGKGTGGLRGYMQKLATEDTNTMGYALTRNPASGRESRGNRTEDLSVS